MPEYDTSPVAVVTGAGSGVGAAVTKLLRSRGYTVAACDIAAGITTDAHGYQLDVTDHAAVESTVNDIETHLGPIAALANVAGVLRSASLLETSPQDWSRQFDVNATGVFAVTRAVASRMHGRKNGAIVTVTSNAAGIPRHGMGAYAASKAAAAHVTRCFGLELAQANIRCNVVAPGSTDTPMLHSLADGNGPKSIEDAIAGSPDTYKIKIPLHKVATPQDVANTVAFLLSDEAGHLTMQEIYVDGGASLK